MYELVLRYFGGLTVAASFQRFSFIPGFSSVLVRFYPRRGAARGRKQALGRKAMGHGGNGNVSATLVPTMGDD